MNLDETKLIELVLGSNKREQGLFRKYGFLHILSNTVTLDTIACILNLKSTSIFIIDLFAFD